MFLPVGKRNVIRGIFDPLFINGFSRCICICYCIIKAGGCYAHPKDSVLKHFIHQVHSELKKDEKSLFNLTGKKNANHLGKYKPDTHFHLNYEVFGWYPFWEKDYYKEINFSLLSTVAYFSYEVNPSTGHYKRIYDWKHTPMIDSAKASGTKVLLTVSNFGDKDNHTLLSNPKAVRRLVSTLVKLLALRDANGVCIDFEGLSHEDKGLFTGFMTQLNNAFKPNKYLIYCTLPNVDVDKSYDYQKLVSIVDKFVIMGYPYYCNVSDTAGPVSPVQSGDFWGPYSLKSTLDYYVSNKLPDSSLILAVPYFGIIWDTDSNVLKSGVRKFKGYRTYNYLKSETPHIEYDSISKSAYSVYKLHKGRQIRQCWFENDSTLADKLAFVKANNLAGVGIWALGYDKGYADLWNVISTGLTKTASSGSSSTSSAVVGSNGVVNDSVNARLSTKQTDSMSVSAHASTLKKLNTKLSQVTDYKTLLLYVIAFVSVSGAISFLIAMLAPNTRILFFGDEALRWYFVGTVLLFWMVCLRLLNIIDNTGVVFFMGAGVGAGSYYLATKMIERKNEDIP